MGSTAAIRSRGPGRYAVGTKNPHRNSWGMMKTGMNWTAWNSLRAKALATRPSAMPTKAPAPVTSTTQGALASVLTPRKKSPTNHMTRDWRTPITVKAAA